MAIYHFSAKVISRAAGSSALAAAAYRSASRLHDERLDRHHDFSNKAGVIRSEVMLPEGAPEYLSDRQKLWNAVEAAELRKDAQLAREIELAIPRELSPEMGIDLARSFVGREFVARGMIADLNVHWDVGADGQPKPHAHVMLTMREVRENGFGAKTRDWNRTALLQHWREAWAEHVNQRLAELDIDARVDHRSLEAQGIDLEPQNKIGAAASRMAAKGLSLERVDEHREIARLNGEKLIANPELALDAITRAQATFTRRDAAMFIHRHSEGMEQFDRIMAALRASEQVVSLGRDGRGDERFTSREMLATEKRLELATARLEARRQGGIADHHREIALARAEQRGLRLTLEQQSALEHVTGAKDLSSVVGYAGTGKSAMLGVAREAWELGGHAVRGAALSGIAAENLESGSGIQSRTIASLEHQWAQGRELLAAGEVLVIDEAGMIGTRQMERVISEAEKRGAKVVLVGDPEQLQAIEAGAAFRSIAERHGWAEITDIRRQREGWQRAATRQLATGRTDQALAAYDQHGNTHVSETRDQARAGLIEAWDQDRAADPTASRIILTHTNDEVQALNGLARDRLRQASELGEDVVIETTRGSRRFAAGDRIMFLRNERSLGVKNGSLGRMESSTAAQMAVLLDDGRQVAFEVKDYRDLDHGYAATIHKAQGVTVDRVHVLATPGLDRHASYVALSRHRDRMDLHYGRDDFADRGSLVRALSRERGKDMASDYQPQVERSRQPAQSPSQRLAAAVQRAAIALQDVKIVREGGGVESPAQARELEEAGKALNEIRPNASRDLRAAFMRDMRLLDEVIEGRTGAAIKSMEWERRYRSDPQLRADHFVKTWRALSDQHCALQNKGDEKSANRVHAQMSVIARGLERDAQVESLLRSRERELGIPPFQERPLSQVLPNWIGWGRGRGIER
jgi:Ti-type conjugative transfer relaxase TraA